MTTPTRKPERVYIRMFPRNENRNEGTFACSPGTKTRTRVHSPKPPFYETALLSPGEISASKHASGGHVISVPFADNESLCGFGKALLQRPRRQIQMSVQFSDTAGPKSQSYRPQCQSYSCMPYKIDGLS